MLRSSRTNYNKPSQNVFAGKARKANGQGVTKRRGLTDITNSYNMFSSNGGKSKKAAVKTGHAGAAANKPALQGITPRLSSLSICKAQPVAKDIDAKDRENPLAVTEYVNDIMNYFRRIEGINGPSPNYMTKQPHINAKMRAILVDWLVEVHLKFKLMPETLYLTVNLIDRFLERKVVARQRLQLVGVTCMLLASKYEEIYFPEVRDFVYITDRAYTRQQILQMESLVLNTLSFELTVPTAIVFTKRFLKAASASNTTKNLARYFAERTMQEYSMLKYLPSTIAASCVSLALKANNQPSWVSARAITHNGGCAHAVLSLSVSCPRPRPLSPPFPQS